MKTIRVYKTINYWTDVELEDGEDELEAMDLAMDKNFSDWDSEVVDENYFIMEN